MKPPARWLATMALLALATFAPRPLHALTVSGNGNAQADAGSPGYVPLPGPESTTGPVEAIGNCSRGRSQAWISLAGGSVSLACLATGGASPPSCIASSAGAANSGFGDDFLVTSATLPPGTLVDLTLCVNAAIRDGVSFSCGGSVYEGVTNTASVDVGFGHSSQSTAAHGTYSERWNCFDGHQRTTTGLFSAGAGSASLVLTQVPVGGLVTLSVTMSGSASGVSYFYGEAGHVEASLTWGYSSPADVRLVSTSTQAECSTLANCSPAAALAALPPAPAVLAVGGPAAPAGVALAAPFPNPARGAMTLTFSLPAAGHAELAVHDVAGARVATLARGAFAAGEHRVAWNGRAADDRPLAPGLYWLRLETPAGRASRPLVLRP